MKTFHVKAKFVTEITLLFNTQKFFTCKVFGILFML